MQQIGIITAMREEAEHIIERYHLKHVHTLSTLEIYESDDLVLALSGIGKVQASIAASYLCQNYDLESYINIGIAGNLRAECQSIWDVFIVSWVMQHDMYLPFEWVHLDYARADIELKEQSFWELCSEGFAVILWAGCLTWDQFIDDALRVQSLSENHPLAHVVEMEAYAIAATLREYGKLDRLICIKSISDGADSDAREAHMSHLDYAMKNSLKVLEQVIEKL